MKKRGQLQLSFGMIFSIILIIVFIAFAFYAIMKFLDIKDTALIGKFQNKLQKDVDKIWKGQQGSQKVEYILPNKIEAVCFVNDEYENLIYQSKEFIPRVKIEHIDSEKSLSGSEKLCFENVDGKISLIIKMNPGEKLVTLAKIAVIK